MKKVSYLAAAVSLAAMSSSWAMTNIQPDPQNPNGYVVARADIQAAEQAQTSDPMYQIWSQALTTAPNSVVEAIEPNLATNPDTLSALNVCSLRQSGIF